MEIRNDIGNEIYGSGVPVVFLHGMGSSSTVWKPIVKELKHDRQCILFDLPGHGKTPLREWDPLALEDIASIIINEIDKLNIEKFHLVGHSLGGWVGLEIASAQPERILSFTAIAPAGLWRHKHSQEYPSIPVLKLMNITLPIFAKIIPRVDRLKRIAFAPSVYDYKKVDTESATDAILAFSIACNAWYKSKRANQFHIQGEHFSNGFNKYINPKVPITVLFGDKDISATPERHQDRTLLPDQVKWVVLPDSGHVPMWDNYDKVLDEIRLNIYRQN
jgi:pimeloyl-ACP methyl ester carboxylesterase